MIINDIEKLEQKLEQVKKDMGYVLVNVDIIKSSEHKLNYQKEYNKNHKEEISKRKKIYKSTIIDKINSKIYRYKYRKFEYLGYIGICICPNCDERGYLITKRIINIKTKHFNDYYEIIHQHSEKGKTIHDRTCYGGSISKNNIIKIINIRKRRSKK